MSNATKDADLCWGQRSVWLRYHQLPPFARHDTHLVIEIELSDGVSIAGLRATLNYLVRRHEALRTTYHFDVAGDPRQRVHPPGSLPLSTASADRDGTEAPADVIERLSTADFDLAQEWPMRACVVTAGGRPQRLVLVLNHMAFDAWTIDRLGRDLAALSAGIATGRPAVLEPIRHQPLDLARYESSVGAAAAKDGALAYWRDEIAQMPADTFGPRRIADDDPVARSAALTSPSMLDTSRRIATRHQTWPSLMHLTTYAMVMAAYTGGDRVAHLTYTGNRESNPYNDVMTCLSTPLLMQVDCTGDPSFTEVLRRTAERFEHGQRNAYVPFDELVELVSRESVRRGQVLRTGSELNFLSVPAQAANVRHTALRWNPTPTAWAAYGSDTYLRLHELQDAVVVELRAHSTVLDADAMERFLRGYEAVLLAHDDPSVDLRISDVARMIGFAAPTAGRPPVGDEPAPTAPDDRRAAGDDERVLAAVVAEVNGLDRVSMADSYTIAGGRVLRIPRVLAELREHGWEGVTVYQIAGGQPLSAIAGMLTRTAVSVA
ncbi:hypothetical protein F4553_007060 [Allocatelliglobosispora scoriae]|uniref:Condensation domain-containing protein n=1 Tax=Allocatelliglobosispora scoriae TaxID=643052 RepID=A0A841C181_9ACTN|nr:condensation domain-containing protein [Allocatelliglobosispora scoriae]MBB5873626.1 hypothetical protein [Allocatelliglobosispora scoriae]